MTVQPPQRSDGCITEALHSPGRGNVFLESGAFKIFVQNIVIQKTTAPSKKVIPEPFVSVKAKGALFELKTGKPALK